MSGEVVYKDLIGFLQSERADLRKAASEAVLQVTDQGSMASLIKYGAIAPLCRLASRSTSTTGEDEASGITALEALVQLSSQGTSINQCIEDILNSGGINRMTEIALTPCTRSKKNNPKSVESWRKRVNFSLALLANMTRTERGAVDLCGYSMPEEAVHAEVEVVNENEEEEEKIPEKLPSKPTMALLTAMFLFGGNIKEKEENDNDEETEDKDKDGHKETETEKSQQQQQQEKNKDEEQQAGDIMIMTPNEFSRSIDKIAACADDPFQHFAAVLMNATQVEQGRRFVMKINHNSSSASASAKPTSILQRILPELRSTNPIRRRGISGTLKNCCFDKDSSWWLLNEVDVLPNILYPLSGPEELDLDEKRGMDPDLWLEGPDKVREPDQVARLLLVEAVLLLCATGRRSREQIRVQRTYVVLKTMDMSEESEEISERIDECVQYLRRDEEGTHDGSSDDFVYDTLGIGKKKMLALPAPSASEQVGGEKKSDDDYDDID
uniref:Protein HGH1 homolog n=1 Tax=Chaetoceros debilis TaxID=122233 RepID=A0A7S3QJL9_9STRA|mmetsp:Transcript_25588/g.37829  ORF Transcript_25588/g.37829 Transcript_25588/m.37829 type:complete len:497 (-) Transcript_25588:27-1517(-)|eukprot:CAMPEP_0194083578 /NCGR_PEP_ID=MMETSP0149-20130528/9642_1 /TAXON_ID=122233 /ORGANISM="Chaetoceros debilis, Strain MM31A-1" /LENGTH=496 /DNA_ID=CAMNT_0038766013 /DNA_START=50 /DNA_END=1540 /DNA_ORIENTATION=-